MKAPKHRRRGSPAGSYKMELAPLTYVRAAPTGAAEATRLPSFGDQRTAEAQEAAGRHSESQERAARGKHLAAHP